MIKTDRGRAQIVREFFNHDINDPSLYDLVVNVAKLGPQCAADTIVQAYRQRPIAQAKHEAAHATA
jgi:cytidylate kinase